MGTSDASPHLIKGNDKKNYVVKFPPEDDRRSNYNEYLGANLARHCKLAVLDTTIMELTPKFTKLAQDDFGETSVKPGYYFATLYYNSLEVKKDTIARMDPNMLSNQSDVAVIIAFDVFISNRDRHKKNLLIVVDFNSPKQYKYVLIDHGNAFGGKEWSYMTGNPLPYTTSLPPWKLDGITMRQFENAATSLCGLTADEIDGFLDGLPSEWRNHEYDMSVREALNKREEDKILTEITTFPSIRVILGLKENI